MCWREILSKVAKKDETNLLLPNPFFIFASDDLNKKINLKKIFYRVRSKKRLTLLYISSR